MHVTSHVDRFAAERLPPREQWPELLFELPELQFPERLNCASELLDRARRRRAGRARLHPRARRPALDLRRPAAPRQPHRPRAGRRPGRRCPATACCCARRTTPMLAACWFAVMKAGGDRGRDHAAAARARSSGRSSTRRRSRHALCDARLRAELEPRRAGADLQRTCRCSSTATRRTASKRCMARQASRRSTTSTPPPTTPACSRFTSGTTGAAEGDDALPPRRDGGLRMLAAARAARRRADDVFIGSPPLGLHLRARRAAAVPDERRRVDACCSRRRRPTELLPMRSQQHRRDRAVHRADLVPRDGCAARAERIATCSAALRKCVSAGEALPAATRAAVAARPPASS